MNVEPADPRAPDGGHWAIQMRWERLLLAHWAVPPATLRPLIPAGLALDEVEGTAWLAIVPFRMTRVGPNGLGLPRPIGTFGELNVRTYVVPVDPQAGPPGIWFLSLDAASPYVVAGARAVFHLPYFRARIAIVEMAGGTTSYRSRRTHRGAPAADFRGRYRPLGPIGPAATGSPIDRLTARFALYSVDGRGRLFRGDIRHRPWQLADAEAELDVTSLAASHGLSLPGSAPLLHYAESLDVIARLPVKLPDSEDGP